MKLHVGGVEVKEGWTLFNIQPGPGVDIVGDLRDLTQFGDETIEEIYASHVLEHVPFPQIPDTLTGIYRVLTKDGTFKVAVPDLDALCQLMLNPEAPFEVKLHVMRIMFGGQLDAHDYHYCGWTEQILGHFLGNAGFARMQRVDTFGLFADTSDFDPYKFPISLNVIAYK